MGRLIELLIKHEGLMLKPYRCSSDKTSIGVGRNLDDVGISKDEAMLLLAHDIERVMKEAGQFSWFQSLNIPRQDVVLSMLFNMGLSRFNSFKKFILCLISGNFERAADEMLDSKWATQVGLRAKELAQMMRSGRYPI
jgi:lysozyme